MTVRKERLTVTVDVEAVEAGNVAVSSGAASSLSAWVNNALLVQARRDQRLRALDDAVADYESEHGEITDEEIRVQDRRDRESAVVVRGVLSLRAAT
jgi:hypothetical protein